MKKKGQIQQVFIYILAIIIVGLIILIGYKAIDGMIKKSCDVQKTNFQTKIRTTLDRNSEYGTKDVAEIDTPCGYFEVCFVDKDKIGDTGFISANPLIQQSVRDGVTQNIFMMKANVVEPIGYDEKIKTSPNGIVCIESKNNKFNMQFDGQGRTVLISDPYI